LIRRIRLKNFRNYDEITCGFEPGINLVVGENGLGKTNLIEAVYILARGRSMRTSETGDLIRKGEKEALIEGWMGEEGRDKAGIVLVEGEESRKSGHGKLTAVAFLPDDSQMVRGNPEMRRKYTDDVIRDIKPGYQEVMREYARGLRQRNEAIKRVRRGNAEREEIHYWDELLVSRGMEVVGERKEILRRMEEELNRLGEFWEMKNIEIKYYTNLETGEGARTRNLEKMRMVEEADLRRGATLVGAHRDEMIFRMGGKDLRREGSHGEQKILSLMWRLAHAEIVGMERKERPVILLDDCFSELDERNRRALCRAVEGWGQVIMTATEEVGCLKAGHVIKLEECHPSRR